MEVHRRGVAISIARGLLRGLGAVGVLVLGATLAAGCGGGGTAGTDASGLPTGFITWQFVKSRPEGTLVYPGATKLRDVGWNTNQAGSPSAEYGGIYTTSATPAEIYAWYGRWLDAHGWALYRDQPKGGATVWLSNRDYQRNGREVFTVAIDNPRVLGRVLGAALPAGGTVFEYRYDIYPPGQGPRSVPPSTGKPAGA